MIVALLYRLTRALLSVPAVLLRRNTNKDAELLVLHRHPQLPGSSAAVLASQSTAAPYNKVDPPGSRVTPRPMITDRVKRQAGLDHLQGSEPLRTRLATRQRFLAEAFQEPYMPELVYAASLPEYATSVGVAQEW